MPGNFSFFSNLMRSILLWIDRTLLPKTKALAIKIMRSPAIFGMVLFSCVALYALVKVGAPKFCKIILNDSNTRNSPYDEYVVGVEAAKAISGSIQDEVRSIGQIKGCKEVMLRAEVNSKITKVAFQEGSNVKKGDILIEFDNVEFVAEVEQANAEYTLSVADFERIDAAYKKKAVPLKDYDTAKAKMAAAKARLEKAKDALAKTTIVAPFDGYIGTMKVAEGNLVQRNQDLAFIVDTSTVVVEFMIPAKYANVVGEGQSVKITVDSYATREFQGIVKAVDSSVDPKNHSILVKSSINNDNQLLKHGLYANVTLVIGEKVGVILVPEDAVSREGSIDFVWFIDEKGIAYRRRVLVGAKSGYNVEIITGLQGGELVVIAGHLKLSDGAKTKILNPLELQDVSGKEQSVNTATQK